MQRNNKTIFFFFFFSHLYLHREKVNLQAEKECRMKQLIAHQSSRDSAIGDAGSQEWETETVEFETERVRTVES